MIVDVGGVGYELTVPQGTLGEAVGLGDGLVTLYVHTHVREDAFVLYGFSSLVGRRVFRVLLGVPNVGPRLAMSVLSVLSVGELARAVEARDVSVLVRVPGVGKKLADRLVLELAGKLLFALEGEVVSKVVSSVAGKVGDQVVKGLTRLGYKVSEAEWAVGMLGGSVEERAVSEVIRDALALLSR